MTTNAQRLDPQSTVWDCLNIGRSIRADDIIREKEAKLFGPLHADRDVISLRDITLVEIRSDEQGNSALYTSDVGFIESETIDDWLQKTIDDATGNGTVLLRLLIGNQVAQNDALRPPVLFQGTHLSRTALAKHFHIPAIAAEKLGFDVSYGVTYPPLVGTSSAVECHSIVTGGCSAAWAHDASVGVNSAFFVLGPGGSDIRKRRLLKLLDLLKDCSHLPNMIPYILLDLSVDALTSTVSSVELHAIDDHRQVLMGLAKKERLSMFNEAAMRLNRTSYALKHASCVMSMSEQAFNVRHQRPNSISDDGWTKLQASYMSIQQLIGFRQQELERLVAHVKFQREQATNLQSQVMGLMSFNQQETSQLIAERTKADGTSMKTLAVIAAVYLPTTAIAAVFSMPIFNWSTNISDNRVVNPRLWIFFAFAVPLTLLTMVSFWAWVKWENEGSDLKPKLKLPSLPKIPRLRIGLPRRRKSSKEIV